MRVVLVLPLLLSGCIFFVEDLGHVAETAQPSMAWSVHQAQAKATVVATDPDVMWEDFAMRYTSSGQLRLDSDTVAMHVTYTRLPAGMPHPGDVLTFCTDAGGGLTATLRHTASNTIAREFVFTHVPPC